MAKKRYKPEEIKLNLLTGDGSISGPPPKKWSTC